MGAGARVDSADVRRAGVLDSERIHGSHASPGRQGARGEVLVLVPGTEEGLDHGFKYQVDPQRDFVKRIVGLPGDVIEVRDGVVIVNGTSLSEPYVRNATCSR